MKTVKVTLTLKMNTFWKLYKCIKTCHVSNQVNNQVMAFDII